MEQWAASLLLGNDTKVSEDQRSAAFSGNGDDLGDYGWKLFAWKKKQPWWKKAITMAVGAIAGTICAVGVSVLTEGAGTVAAGAAAGACGGVASQFTDSMLNGEGFVDSLGSAFDPKAMVINTLIGGFTAGVFELGGNAVSRIIGTGTEAVEGEAGAVASEELGGTATEVAGGVDTGLVHGPPLGRPNFIVSSNGEIVAVPEGAVGPTMADSGNGMQFTGGSGGRGLDPRVTDIRVMDPVTTGKYTYPDGYVSYSNAAGQTVSPVTGQTIGRSDPFWHWQWGPK